MTRVFFLLMILVVPLGGAAGHELRPGFLEIRETGTDTYAVRLKVPARGDMRLGLYARLPRTCKTVEPLRSEQADGSVIDRFTAVCPGGLAGASVSVDGLASTLTDVMVRIGLADGSVQSARLTPDAPSIVINGAPTWTETVRTYFLLGVEHILLGIDHLLFVLVLLLLIRDRWMLVKAITAFTVAHSITLAAATLGWAAVPQTPVEAVIALSIAFTAAAVLREGRHDADLAIRFPWLVAFAFGLLHGFGFAGALAEIGLPQSDVPIALLTFNLGIEAGQLLFVGTVLALLAMMHRLVSLQLPALRGAVAYAIGCLGAFWFVERTLSMV